MYKFFTYPLNVGCVLLLALVFALCDFSTFYDQPGSSEIFLMLIMSSLFFLQYFFLKNKANLNIGYLLNSNLYKKYLFIAFFGFLIEFSLFGIPLFSESGRDGVKGIPVLHVVFYSCTLVAMIFASLYARKRDIFICFVIVLLLSVMLLSRQMMMVSFLILFIVSFTRYKITATSFIKIIISLFLIIFLFGVIGNLRQSLAGDYVDQYIIVVGGANENGEKLGDIFYWFWLYIASPIYNLWVNFDSYYNVGEHCNTNVYYGSCSGNYFSAVILPDTIAKYTGLEKFYIDLQIAHLNVGTGYAAAARIFGLSGVLLQIILQAIFYVIGYKLIGYKFKLAYVVYFSALSILMIFDNLFIRGEFFFVFVLLYLAKYKFTWGKS